MPGVRIRPKPDRNVPDNALIILRDISRPLKYRGTNKHGQKWEDVAPVCATCHRQHDVKTYHLQLRAGSIIVGKPIWEKFQQMPDDGGFEFVNIVENPPAQGISPGKEIELIEKYPVNEVNSHGWMTRLAYKLNPSKVSKTATAGEDIA